MGDEAVRAVMFADLAGFTALTEAHGDSRAVDAAVRFGELAEGSLGDGARVVKTIGDAVLVVAPDARSGVDAALSILRRVDTEPEFPGVRVGLHAGPVLERLGDVFGATVNIAARLAERAHVGQLLTTAATATLVSDLAHVSVRSLGPTRLKNIGEALELFSIEDTQHEPLARVLDPVCRMYVDADEAPARLPWGDRIWSFCSFECASTFVAAPERFVTD